MSTAAMNQLIDRWMNDGAFRTELRSDPEGTIRAHNLDLSADEWSAIRKVDWSLSDESLQARVSQFG